MKRILSVIPTLITVLTVSTTAFAVNDDTISAANTLHELGLFQGAGTNPDGTPDYGLDLKIQAS